MCYGADGQKKMADFSEGALENVRTKDLGQTGDMITDLIGELRGFDAAADEKGFLGFFRKKSAKVSALKAKYDKAEVNVERIAGELEKHQITLLKDVSMLDKMYEENLLYFKQLTMYILANLCGKRSRAVCPRMLKRHAILPICAQGSRRRFMTLNSPETSPFKWHRRFA